MEDKSRLPALTFGVRDHSALRSGATFGSLAGQLETSLLLTKYSGSGTQDTRYYKVLGEIYSPVYEGLYVGLGYRALYDDSGGTTTSTGARTYDRLSQYLYVPMGSLQRLQSGASLKTQVNVFLAGRQTSYFTDISSYRNDVQNKQTSGYGLDISYSAPSGGWEVFGRYWRIAESNTAALYTASGSLYGYMYEPRNNTFEVGARFGF